MAATRASFDDQGVDRLAGQHERPGKAKVTIALRRFRRATRSAERHDADAVQRLRSGRGREHVSNHSSDLQTHAVDPAHLLFGPKDGDATEGRSLPPPTKGAEPCRFCSDRALRRSLKCS